VSRPRIALLVCALLLAGADLFGPSAAWARAPKISAEKAAVALVPTPRKAPRPKTTRVNISQSNGADVVLEAKAPEPDDVSTASADGTASGDAADVTSAASEEDTSPAETPLPLDEGKWDPVCTQPCERRLPRAAVYRITGEGLTTSSLFNLPANRPDVTLRVRAGTARWYWTGVVASIFGASFLLGGVAPPLLQGGSFSTTGKVLGGAGVVLLGGGVPLWILNRTTVVIF
jgi:hypothetical protein